MASVETLPAPSGSKTCPRCGRSVEEWAAVCPDCGQEWPEWGPGVGADQREAVRARVAFEKELEEAGSPPRVTYVLLAMNVLVFIVMVVSGVGLLNPEAADLARWGANFPPATMGGAWWRLFTATFIHIGLIHLAFNLYVLWGGGLQMERLLGPVGFSITYLLAGLAGSVATLVFHPRAVGAGASGAIFGLYGALLAFLVRDRATIPRPVFVDYRKNTLVFLGYNLIFSLKPGVDLSAHFGGLVMGFACGWPLCRKYQGEGGFLPPGRRRLTLALGLLAVGGLALGAARHHAALPFGGMGQADLEGEMRADLQAYFDRQTETKGIQVRRVTLQPGEGQVRAGTAVLWWVDREVALPLEVSFQGDRIAWTLGAAHKAGGTP